MVRTLVENTARAARAYHELCVAYSAFEAKKDEASKDKLETSFYQYKQVVPLNVHEHLLSLDLEGVIRRVEEMVFQ